jgi:cation:H+ antiporter
MDPVLAVVSFSVGAIVITRAGSALARLSRALAARTGIGQAFFGAIFLGGVTSLPGVVASVSAASGGYPELALANAFGGISAQTVFLAIADITHRKVNLEHAAASLPNIVSGVVLIALLTTTLLVAQLPAFDVFGVHPGSLVLLVAYVSGMSLVRQSRDEPNWQPRWTAETERDQETPRQEDASPTTRLWWRFAGFAVVVALAGHVVARAGIAIVEQAGMSEAVVGALFTAVVTSLPELVTALAAVRCGALRLAVGDILGGNCFDVLFVVAADVAFRPGSILHVSTPPTFLIALPTLLTSILILGLLQRQKHGIANIGFESFLVLLVYSLAVVWMSAN